MTLRTITRKLCLVQEAICSDKYLPGYPKLAMPCIGLQDSLSQAPDGHLKQSQTPSTSKSHRPSLKKPTFKFKTHKRICI